MKNWKLQPATDLGLPYRQRLESPQRESGLVEWMMHHVTWSSLAVFLRVHQDIKIFGRQRLPAKPPFVIVANHTSHLDALALGAALGLKCRGNISPLAAADIFFDSTLKAMFAAFCLNATPMQRKRAASHSIRNMREQLQHHEASYVLFPEGTRSRDGNLTRFKPGIGMLVAETQVPVIPCHISGAFASWPAYHKRPRAGHLVVHIGRPLTFASTENNRSGWRKTADELELAVAHLSALAPRAPIKRSANLDSGNWVAESARFLNY